MALRCTNCGSVLPGDDAKRCNNCGMVISTRPAHLAPSPVPKGEPDPPLGSKSGLPQAASGQRGSTPTLREQIAQQPPARPIRLVSPNEGTPSLSKGEGQDKLDRAKAALLGEKEKPGLEASKTSQEQIDEDPPTQPLAAHPPASSMQPDAFSASTHPIQGTQQDEVELLNTVPLAAPVRSSPMTPIPSVSPLFQRASPVEVGQEQGEVQSQQVKENIVRFVTFPHLRPTPLRALSVLFSLLLVVGLGIWIVKFQPFSVPAVTQPQQSFKDVHLGLSLLYPTGWIAQVDHAQSTIHFYDSSHTAEVMIVVKNAASENVAQYLQQQVRQLGMTGARADTALSFAGVTWQSVQGSVQVSGANYTATILATVHRGRLFGLIQLAPQSIYADEDRLVFADMRSSLQFV